MTYRQRESETEREKRKKSKYERHRTIKKKVKKDPKFAKGGERETR